jgi:hypothetical protein
MSADRRFLARAIVGWCAALLPADRKSWAAAMRAEVDAIERENVALAFAAGCFLASIKEQTLTMNFAARIVRFAAVAAMLTLALAAAMIAKNVAAVHAPSAFVFGLTSLLFAGTGTWSVLRGPTALIRTATAMIPVYLLAYIVVQSNTVITDDQANADLYRALAIEGVVIWAALLAGGIFILRAAKPSSDRRA